LGWTGVDRNCRVGCALLRGRVGFGEAGVVGGVDVVDLKRAVGIHDDGGFLIAGEGEVVHGGGHERESAGVEGAVGGGGAVELVSHAEGDGAGGYDDVLISGVPVGGDVAVGRELDAQGERAGLGGVSSKDGDLDACGEHGSWSPVSVFGCGEDVGLGEG
jgi:hypothetical protein